MAFLLIPIRIGLGLAAGLGRGAILGGRVLGGGGRGGGGGGGGGGLRFGGGGSINVDVRVTGLRELIRDLNRANAQVAKEVRTAMRDAAQPVLADARRDAMGWGVRTAGGYAVSATQRGVVVRQRLRKTTGHHPSFGGLQMREALIPALESNQERVVNDMFDAVDDVLRRNGL